MSNIALNRTVVAMLTNKSGGAHAQGDVCVIDSANASAVVNTTTSAYIGGQIAVCLDPGGVADNAIGSYAVGGFVPKINLSSSASLGDLFKTHTVAKQAVRHTAPIVSGDFGIVLGTGTTPAAILFGSPKIIGGVGGGGGLVFLEKHIASSSGSLDFVNFSDTYNNYLLKLSGIVPASGGVNAILRLATDASPTWDSGSNYNWTRLFYNLAGTTGTTAGGTDTSMQVGAALDASATTPFEAEIWLCNMRQTSAYKTLQALARNWISSSMYKLDTEALWTDTTHKAFGVRLLMSSGNIVSGYATLYGLAEA